MAGIISMVGIIFVAVHGDASSSVWISQTSFRGETNGGVGCFLRLGKKRTTEEEPSCMQPLNRVFIYFLLTVIFVVLQAMSVL